METDLPQSLTKKRSRKNNKIIYLVLAGFALLLIGFTAGYYSNNGKSSSTIASSQGRYPGLPSNGSSNYGGYGGYGANYGNRALGTVSSVNGQTIVITERDGSNQTVQISSSTQFSNGTSASQIAVGDTIMALGTKNSSGVIQATRIDINPTYGNRPSSSTQSPQTN